MKLRIVEMVEQGARWAIASERAGCGCVGLEEVYDRAGDPDSVYYAFRDRKVFDGLGAPPELRLLSGGRPKHEQGVASAMNDVGPLLLGCRGHRLERRLRR